MQQQQKHIRPSQSKLFGKTKFSDLHFCAEELTENAIKTCKTLKKLSNCGKRSAWFKSSETYLWEAIWLQGMQGKKNTKHLA